jgi:uncharacterized protein HemY
VNLAQFAMMAGNLDEARAQVAELQRLAPDEPRVQALASELGLEAPPRKVPAGRLR